MPTVYCGRYGTGSTLNNPTRNWGINQTRSDTRLVMLMLVIIGPPLLIILGTALSRNPLSKYKHGKWYQTREITDNDEVSKRPTVTDPVNWFPTWKWIFRWGKYPNWIVNGMLRRTKPRAWSSDTIQGNYFELEAFFLSRHNSDGLFETSNGCQRPVLFFNFSIHSTHGRVVT